MAYHRMKEPIWFPEIGLGLSLWQGKFEELELTWLRWVDGSRQPIPTGAERAEQERQRAETLALRLARLGADPEA
jgi:hypothetical protein